MDMDNAVIEGVRPNTADLAGTDEGVVMKMEVVEDVEKGKGDGPTLMLVGGDLDLALIEERGGKLDVVEASMSSLLVSEAPSTSKLQASELGGNVVNIVADGCGTGTSSASWTGGADYNMEVGDTSNENTISVCIMSESGEMVEIVIKSSEIDGFLQMNSQEAIIVSEEDDATVGGAAALPSPPPTSLPGLYKKFRCELCLASYDKKTLLNSHMRTMHGVHYVYAEKKNKVRLVRLPDFEPNHSKSTDVNSSQQLHLQVVEKLLPDQQNYDLGGQISEEDPEETLGCGFAVKVNTEAYKIALERNQTPFVGFLPINQKRLYLLKIRDFQNGLHMLEPATKEDAQSCLLNVENENGEMESEKIAIVALLQQYFNEEKYAVDLALTDPQEDLYFSPLRLISPKRFLEMAFANPSPVMAVHDNTQMDHEDRSPARQTTSKPKGKRRGRKSKAMLEQEKKEKDLEERNRALEAAALAAIEEDERSCQNEIESAAAKSDSKSVLTSNAAILGISSEITLNKVTLNRKVQNSDMNTAPKPKGKRRGRKSKAVLEQEKKEKELEERNRALEEHVVGDERSFQNEISSAAAAVAQVDALPALTSETAILGTRSEIAPKINFKSEAMLDEIPNDASNGEEKMEEEIDGCPL